MYVAAWTPSIQRGFREHGRTVTYPGNKGTIS